MSVAIPQFMKKIQKSMYGTVGYTVPAAWCLTGVLVKCLYFFTPCMLFLLIFSLKLKQEEWIPFLNE
jgi:hypothetical protein